MSSSTGTEIGREAGADTDEAGRSSTPGGTASTVDLAFPAQAEHVRLARLVASGLVAQAGYSVDEIEDLRIAVDELCSLLVDNAGVDARVVLTFRLDEAAVAMTGEVAVPGGMANFEFDELSTLILRAAVDRHVVRAEEGRLVVELAKFRPDRSQSAG